MGIKMYEARYGVETIKLKQYKDEMHGRIQCKSSKYKAYLEKQDKYAMAKQLLKENPLMSFKEFNEKTGLARRTYSNYRNELKESVKQSADDKYIKPFRDNPSISAKEYMVMVGCGKSTYYKYKRMFNKTD